MNKLFPVKYGETKKGISMKKRFLSILLCICTMVGLLPTIAFAASDSTTTDMSEMNALEAIGIDTSVAPEDYDVNDTSNPYGKNVTTLNPVSELLLMTEAKGYSGTKNVFNLTATLNGHADSSLTTYNDFMSDTYARSNVIETSREYLAWEVFQEGIAVPEIDLNTVAGNFTATAIAAGNFDGNTEGQEKQYVLLSLERPDSIIGNALKLQVLDACEGKADSANALTLTDNFLKYFGNSEDEGSYTYQLQNYLQVAAGDFDGNGIDEIAVYIADKNDPRIVVYQYQKKSGTSNNSYQNMSNWSVVWNYSITKLGQNKDYVPNMVALLAGDFNEDGIEDLAVTYSYFYGENNYDSGRAAVLFGKTEGMFNDYQDFRLYSSDGDEIVRAAFTFGEITGVGTNTLVLGGQSLSDLKKGNIYSRYVALYQFDGNGFSIVTDQNFDLFSKDKNGNYVYSVMKRTGTSKDIFYSSPLAVANLAVVSNGLTEAATLYFDSLYFTYSDSGLELTAALDNTSSYQHSLSYSVDGKNYTLENRWYTEYGAASADLFGLGYDALGTMQHFLPVAEKLKDEMTDNLKDVYSEISQFPPSHQGINGETYFIMTYTEATVVNSSDATYNTSDSLIYKRVNASSSFAFPNTDHDTSYLKYTGNHYYTYSNPEVLAVLASAPYFSDLLNRDDLSGNYAESTTSYGTTKGSGDGVTANASIFAGAYASFEQDIKVFGITIASIEASETITASFTYEFEKTSMLEQSIEYATSVGSDAVVLYSIPVVVYVYEAYTPNGKGDYDQQVMTITSPHTAVTQVMELDTYEEIAKDYSELPQISGNILTHTLGDPTTYPTSSKGYKNALVYDGDYSAVGYSGTGGGATVTQSISMTTEENHSFSGSMAIEASAGVGAGGLVVGVTAGSEAGAGYVMTSTAGSTYTATMQNMPAEAEEYGYALSWKLFAYEQEYYDGKNWKSVPVVNYLVANVEMPPNFPDDFAQDVENTTNDTAALTWSYDKTIAGFQIYRYYAFPDGTGSYEMAFVPFKNGVLQADGTWQFSYADTNLNPYTDYYYQIQAVRSYAPNNSITSEVLTARTKTDVGYPELTLNGLNEDGKLSLYPDSTNTVTVTVGNPEDYPQGISYQWQKLEDGNWVDVSGKTSPAYTFLSSGYSTAGTYRCRVNVVYWDADRGEEYLISAYTDTFESTYSMRTAKVVAALSADVDNSGKPYASVSIETTASSHNVAPTGTVTFEITSLNYSRSYNVALTSSGKTATAKLTTDMTSKMPEGVYEITATYNGSRVFLPLELGSTSVLSGESGYRLAIYDKDGNETNSVVYGDAWSYKLIQYSKSENGSVTQTVVEKYGSKEHSVAGPLTNFGGLFQSARLSVLKDNGGWYSVGSGVLFGFSHDTSKSTYSYDYGYSWYTQTPAGDYCLSITYDNISYQTYFSVTSRPITVGIKTANGLTVPQGQVESNLPTLAVIEGSLAYGDKLSTDSDYTDFVTMHSYNTGGRDITLNNSTPPGSYTITGTVNSNNTVMIEGPDISGYTITSSTDQKYYHPLNQKISITYDRNYSVTFAPATYIVTGQQYSVTVEVGTVNGKTAGTIELISPQSVSQSDLESGITFGSGTSLMFLAKPYEGYRVKSWTVTRGDTAPTTENETNLTLSCTMLAEPLHVALEFEIEQHTLTVVNNTPEGGSVVMPKGFANGAITTPGAEWTFTAVPQEGYSFSHWEFVIGGSNTRCENATITVTMPESNAYLYPVFVRDSYALTLGDNLRAGYAWDHDNNTTTADVTRYVTSGAMIPGDTVVTVEAAPGYEISNDAVWTVDGKTVSNTEDNYTFTMLKDTEVRIETTRGKYDLSVSTANGSVTVVYGEETVAVTSAEGSATLEDIPGATAIAMTAKPDYGYVFAYWSVNGQAVDDSEIVLNILNLSKDTTVTAVFTANDTYTVSGTFNTLQGAVHYQVLDKYGTEQTAGVYTSDITVYDGDTVVLTATPRTSWMVGKWAVNGIVYSSDHSKTKTFESISNDITFAIDFVAQSYYTVNYSIVGEYGENEGGTITSATADTTPFVSGKADVGGGSTVVITSRPVEGWMVKEWKIDGETVTIENGAAYQGDVLTIESLSGSSATVTITVEFQEIVSYSVTIETDESWTITWDNENDVRKYNGEVLEGEKLIFTVSANAGYRLTEMIMTGESFYEIVDNEDGTKTATIYTLTDHLTVSAATKRLYSITCAQTTNGTITVTPDIAATDDIITITVTPNDGYLMESLAATYMDGKKEQSLTISEDLTFIMPNADVEVLAVFDETYTVTFVANGGTVTTTSAETDTDGKLIYLPTPVRDGYLFDGWFTQLNGGTQATVDTVFTSDTTLYAMWVCAGHTGGTADCAHKAKCEVCGEDYGEVDSTNHDFTKQIKSADTLKSAGTCQDEAVYYYSCSHCGEIEKNNTHTFEGEPDSSNHTGTMEWTTQNTAQHEQKWSCCGVVTVSLENHEWKDGVCEECGYGCNHTGGTADCTHKDKINADHHTTLKHVEAKAATAEAEGNIEYWYCESCNKYFSNKDGKNEIKLSDTVVAKLVKTDNNDKTPQTGDNSNMTLWFALIFVSGNALIGTVIYGKKKRFVK